MLETPHPQAGSRFASVLASEPAKAYGSQAHGAEGAGDAPSHAWDEIPGLWT